MSLMGEGIVLTLCGFILPAASSRSHLEVRKKVQGCDCEKPVFWGCNNQHPAIQITTLPLCVCVCVYTHKLKKTTAFVLNIWIITIITLISMGKIPKCFKAKLPPAKCLNCIRTWEVVLHSKSFFSPSWPLLVSASGVGVCACALVHISLQGSPSFRNS